MTCFHQTFLGKTCIKENPDTELLMFKQISDNITFNSALTTSTLNRLSSCGRFDCSGSVYTLGGKPDCVRAKTTSAWWDVESVSLRLRQQCAHGHELIGPK